MRIFAFINSGRGTDWVTGCAIAEDGRCVAGHISSSDEWSQVDMTEGKRDAYEEGYPEGCEVEWVEDVKSHPGLMAAYDLNQKIATTDGAGR